MTRPASDDTPRPLQDGTVTRLVAQQRRPDRVSVYLDGAFAFGVHQDVVVEFGLLKGTRLTVAEQQRILGAEQRAAAKQTAFAYLAGRPRTEQEVRRRLQRKDFDEDAVEHAVERLYALHYLDDAAYARSFARERFQSKGYGPQRIRSDLMRRGVDRHLIDEVLATLRDEEDLVAEARAQAERRWPRLACEPDPRKRKKKLADYLLRRGYTYETVFRVVDEVADAP